MVVKKLKRENILIIKIKKWWFNLIYSIKSIVIVK